MERERERERDIEEGANLASGVISTLCKFKTQLTAGLNTWLPPATVPAAAAAAAPVLAAAAVQFAALHFPVAHSITRISINCHLGTAIFHTT